MALEYRVYDGNGPYLLLVHGMLSSPSQWDLNIPHLEEFCRPITVSLHGHGGASTPSDPEAFHPFQYAKGFDQVRMDLGVEKWFVCGYSLGAALTMRYALVFSDSCFGHIFTNSSSAFALPETTEQWRQTAEGSANNIRRTGLKGLNRIPVHPRHAKRLPDLVKQKLIDDASRHDPEGIAMTVQWTSPFASIRSDIRQNSVPALLACGRFERRFQDHRSFALCNMPLLEVVDLDAGHAVNMEACEEFNATVRRFIESRSRS